MRKPIVFMFSGQGSQFFQMGRELFENHHVFRSWMGKLDKVIKELIGESLTEILYDPNRRKDELFNRTLLSHPAIFVVEYSIAQVFLESGLAPDYVLGASLGEFTSAAVAGVFSPEDALELLIEQAKLIEACCREGSMLAILDNPILYSLTPLLNNDCELAGIHYDSHFVLSGRSEKINEISIWLKKQGILHQKLPVSFAFHSSLIDPVGKVFIQLLNKKTLRKPEISMVSCVDGRVRSKLTPEYFWEVVRRPILFEEAVHVLEGIGSFCYIDAGPSGTLASFAKKNISDYSKSSVHQVMSPFGNELKALKQILDICLK